jgi:hypothetical protein
MRPHEEALLKANAETMQFKALYFQARDEIRKANKGLARLSRSNQVLRDKILALLAGSAAARGVAIDRELADMFRNSGVHVPRNGNGAVHV